MTSRLLLWTTLAGFAVLAFLIYGQTLSYDFVRFDDGLLIFENPAVREFSLKSLKTIFSTYDPELYIPLTLLTYQFDYLLSAGTAWSFHLGNLILHILNATLVSILAFKLLQKQLFILPPSPSISGAIDGRLWGASNYSHRDLQLSIFVGLLFLVHPLHTEAVVWASARKDLLSTFFFLGSLITYLTYRRQNEQRANELTSNESTQIRKHWKFYYISLLLFLLGLLSKVSIITLPIILILYDLLIERRRIDRRMILEKIPSLALALLFGIIAIVGKREALSTITPLETILMAAKSAVFYLQKIFLPWGFSVLYPYEGTITIQSLDFFIPVIVLAGIFSCLVFLLLLQKQVTNNQQPATNHRALVQLILFSSVWYFITLLPTFTNFFKGGELYIASDRYAYIPSIGIFFIVGICIHSLLVGSLPVLNRVEGLVPRFPLISASSYRANKLTSNVIFLAIILTLAFMAHRQSQVWTTSETLFSSAVHLYPNSSVARNNLGSAYLRQGRLVQAASQFEQSIALRPHVKTLSNLGLVYRKQGYYPKAIESYAHAKKIDPGSYEPYVGLALVYEELGRDLEALAAYAQAIERKPLAPEIYVNRGTLFERQGKWEEAASDYRKAILVQPLFAQAHFNLGALFLAQRKNVEALAAFERAIKLSHRDIPSRINAGLILAALGRISDARDQFEHILEVDPGNGVATSAIEQLDAAVR